MIRYHYGRVRFAEDIVHSHPGKQNAIVFGKRRQKQTQAQNVKFEICNRRSKKQSYQNLHCVVCQSLIVVGELVCHWSNCTIKALWCIYQFHVEPFHCRIIPLPF